MTTPLERSRLRSALRAGFATLNEYDAHRRAEHAAMLARIEAERAQEAADRRHAAACRRASAPEAVGFYIVSLGAACFTVSEPERRAAVALAAECPGTEVLAGSWMHRRADGRVVRCA